MTVKKILKYNFILLKVWVQYLQLSKSGFGLKKKVLSFCKMLQILYSFAKLFHSTCQHPMLQLCDFRKRYKMLSWGSGSQTFFVMAAPYDG
jgi:hypothetical protein